MFWLTVGAVIAVDITGLVLLNTNTTVWDYNIEFTCCIYMYIHIIICKSYTSCSAVICTVYMYIYVKTRQQSRKLDYRITVLSECKVNTLE